MAKRDDTGKTASKNATELIRSSAAEYLTFVAATGSGGVEAVYADESIWLSQKMMASLYDVNVRTINEHLKKIFADSELQENSVIRKFRITAADGKTYHTLHYKLPAIIAVGYKVNSERAVQFRKWATGIIDEFTIKAYVMDDERLKSGGSILTEQYFLKPNSKAFNHGGHGGHRERTTKFVLLRSTKRWECLNNSTLTVSISRRSQKLLTELYGATISNMNQHVAAIYQEEALSPGQRLRNT